MKKYILFICSLLISTCIFSGIAKAVTPPEVEGEAAILMDATTGEVIYNKNGDEVLAPASTTKVMTALLVIEKAKLTDTVTIGKKPPTAEGTSIGLKEGEVYTVNDLLHGLLLESANDCADALAEHVGGTIDNFVKMMNERALALGAKHTNFLNANGLYEKDHVTTAFDLSLILREAITKPEFIKISRELVYKFPPSNIDTFEKWVSNKNELIKPNLSHFYKYALSGKTGYTTLSKHTFTCAAEKNGHILIATILKSQLKDYYFPDAKKLFEYGFNNYTLLKLYSKDQQVDNYDVTKSLSMPLMASKDFYYLVKNEDVKAKDPKDILKEINPTIKIESKDLSTTSFKKDDVVLNSKVSVNSKEIGDLPLVASIDRDYKSLIPSVNSSNSSYLFLGALGAALFAVFAITLRKYFIYKKKQKILRLKYENLNINKKNKPE